MNWKDPKKELPPQGKKILAFYSGDCFCSQRFGKHWFPIPFTGSFFARIDEPDLWADIKMPGFYTGKIRVCSPGSLDELIDMEECETRFPEIYKDMVQAMLNDFNNRYDKNEI